MIGIPRSSKDPFVSRAGGVSAGLEIGRGTAPRRTIPATARDDQGVGASPASTIRAGERAHRPDHGRGRGHADALLAAEGPAPGLRAADGRLAGARRPRGRAPGAIAVIVSPDRDLTAGLPEGTETVIQPEADGTGGAIRAAHDIVRDSETVVVLSGDHPLITGEIVAALLETHRAAGAGRHRDDASSSTTRAPTAASSATTTATSSGSSRPSTPSDVDPEVLAIREINTGTYAFDAEPLTEALDHLDQRQLRRRVLPRRRAADAPRRRPPRRRPPRLRPERQPRRQQPRRPRRRRRAEARRQILERHMLAGVTIVDPAATWIDAEVEIAADATIEPGSVAARRDHASAPTRSSARTRP